MTRRDWISLGTTAGLHLLLLLLFAVLSAGRPDVPQIGYMEVEFGPLAEGQPVETAEEPAPSEPAPESPETEEAPEPEPAEEAPEEPVDLPESEDAAEDVPPTEDEPEEAAPNTDPDESDDTPNTNPTPDDDSGAEAEGAPDDNGEPEAEEGTSTDEDRSAPYDIEGLNRDPQFAPLPTYNEQVNARIRVRITVDPQGNIIRRIPLIKGDPALDEAVMNALSRWQFNALPEGAPQENQTGTITFTFRLE